MVGNRNKGDSQKGAVFLHFSVQTRRLSGLKNTKALDNSHKFGSVPHDLTGTGEKADYYCWCVLQHSVAFSEWVSPKLHKKRNSVTCYNLKC
jgi:hypothetical protein